MNRSITQKVLLVITLVTVMGAGTLSQSDTSTTDLHATQESTPATSENDTAGATINYWQLSPAHDCPYHMSITPKNVTGYGHTLN